MKFGAWVKDNKLLGSENEQAVREYEDTEDLVGKYGDLSEVQVEKNLDIASKQLMEYLGYGSESAVDEPNVDRLTRTEQFYLKRDAVRAIVEALQRHFIPRRLDASYGTRQRPWERRMKMLGYSCVEHLMEVLKGQWTMGCTWENFGTEWTVKSAMEHPEITKYGDMAMREAMGPEGIRVVTRNHERVLELEPFLKFEEWVTYHVPVAVGRVEGDNIDMPIGWREPMCVYIAKVKRDERVAKKEAKAKAKKMMAY